MYTFHFGIGDFDERVRLWVDNVLVIDQWASMSYVWNAYSAEGSVSTWSIGRQRAITEPFCNGRPKRFVAEPLRPVICSSLLRFPVRRLQWSKPHRLYGLQIFGSGIVQPSDRSLSAGDPTRVPLSRDSSLARGTFAAFHVGIVE